MGTLSVCVLLTAVAEDHHLNSNFSPWTVLLIDHLFEKVDYPFEDSVLCDTSIKLGEKTFWEIKIKKFSTQITPELLYFSQDWLAAPLLPPPPGIYAYVIQHTSYYFMHDPHHSLHDSLH